MNSQVKVAGVIALALVLASGCAQGTPRCSDESATSLVKQSLLQHIQHEPRLRAVIDTVRSTFNLDAIRTQAEGPQTECAANLKSNIIIRPETSGYFPVNSDQMVSNMLNRDWNRPITYRLERTDKGELYVTVSGIPD